jgi:hypothetical protein
VLAFIQRAAFRRFRNGSPGPWGVVAVGLFGMRTLLRWAKRNEDVVYREVLRPGQEVVVSHRTTTRRKLAKGEARAAKLAAKEAKDARRARRRSRGAAPVAG